MRVCDREKLGSVPTGYLFYFSSKFPELLMYTYHVMSLFCFENTNTPSTPTLSPLSASASVSGSESTTSSKDAKEREKEREKEKERETGVSVAGSGIVSNASTASDKLVDETGRELRYNTVLGKYYQGLSVRRLRQVRLPCLRVLVFIVCVLFCFAFSSVSHFGVFCVLRSCKPSSAIISARGARLPPTGFCNNTHTPSDSLRFARCRCVLLVSSHRARSDPLCSCPRCLVRLVCSSARALLTMTLDQQFVCPSFARESCWCDFSV